MSRTFTRQEFYGLVWSKPMTHLAKEFALSDVALHKIGKKHGIPNPPLGWWAKKAAGKPVILSRIRKGELPDGFTVRDIHQRDWSNLTDREQVRQGLDMLVDHHWLIATDLATGGRPKTIYSINPRGMP